MFGFKKKKVEKKVEPLYEWKYTTLAIDLANIESLNDALSKGFSVQQVNPYMLGNNVNYVLPREGILILQKDEKVLVKTENL